jgi:ABC-type transporter Mla maintaining outer membrane lipid asymmetry ATPase subunit MlaF
VSFRFRPGQPYVHQQVSFEVPGTGMTAFVGPSGAGKSTNQHAVGLAELASDVFLQVVADVIGLPLRSGQEVLQAVGRGVASLFSQLPAVLASHWSE